MRVPVATYRVQLHRSFAFQDARSLLPYIHGLGISHLYTSPFFRARPGSMHGYDVTDPTKFNPELGSLADFHTLADEIAGRGMGLLIDIVPNHMAASPENPFWMDVLENGQASQWALMFDISWEPGSGGGEEKVLLPVLGAPYGKALENQDLTLAISAGGIGVQYGDSRFPLDPKTWTRILGAGLGQWQESGNPDAACLVQLVAGLDGLPGRSVNEEEVQQLRWRQQQSLKRQLWELYAGSEPVRRFIDANLRAFNGVKGDPRSFDPLADLLDEQAYLLAYWRVAREKINYRRFFDISGLVGVRVEVPEVFTVTHELIGRLISERRVSGLRVDHIDGLYDPLGYLEHLQEFATSARGEADDRSFYIVVEKVLSGDEGLPPEWPVAGTSGYDFLGQVNSLFVEPHGLDLLTRFYRRFTGIRKSFADIVYEQKQRVIEELFPGEMSALGLHLGELAGHDRHYRDLSPAGVAQSITEVTACFPVYRTYSREGAVTPRARRNIHAAIECARERNPTLGAEIFDFVEAVLTLDFPATLPAAQRQNWVRFVMRWQQLTSPIIAKGVEDTALYVYNRLISLNDVGGEQRAVSPAEFHRFLEQRQRGWPYSMNATSTHDTKRSEDVRARINVLSEIPSEWGRAASRWSRWNKPRKRRLRGKPAPDANEELLYYQTLVGAWPLDAGQEEGFRERMKAYVIKAAREAKQHTNWLRPDEEYESALIEFVNAILTPGPENRFLDDFRRFEQRVAYFGALNSLSQTLLKIASPGVPDFYQGSVLWDFSLVDPDNRRPVDFPTEEQVFETLREWSTGAPATITGRLFQNWTDGSIKSYVIYRALGVRRAYPELFTRGEYIPLEVRGEQRDHLFAFLRRDQDQWAMVIVPRFVTRLSPSGRSPLGNRLWRDTELILPDGAPLEWRDVFTGHPAGGNLRVGEVFRQFPVSLLRPVERPTR